MRSEHAPLHFSLVVGLAVALLALRAGDAAAEPCFAADGDGTYDQGAADDGVITVTGTSTSSVPPAATPYECSALDFLIASGGALLLEGDPATGAFAALEVGELTIANGGAISADGEGCSSDSGSTGPDASNVCSPSGGGVAGNGNDFGGAGGGGHGGRGASGGVGAGGAPHDSATEPARFGATGGSTGGTGGGPGGDGGGIVSIVADAIVHDGAITADGSLGGGSGGRVAGGGAGGSIFISTASLSGATGTFDARGGNAPGTAGGGGGGRIAILIDGGDFDFDATDFDVSGGLGGSNGDAGTVYVRDASIGTVRIFHGFTFDDRDHVETEWLADDSALNQYCDLGLAPEASPSITAENVVLGGAIDCTTEVASFGVVQTGPGGALTLPDSAVVSANGPLTLEAATTLDVGAGATLANTRTDTDLRLLIPDGDDQIWSGVTVDSAPEGSFALDAAIAVQLLDGTTVAGNVAWPNLTTLTIDATSTIHADGKGCVSLPNTATGPDEADACVSAGAGVGGNGNDFGGGGGGGHGGRGANGGVGTGGVPYDSATAPVKLGASGGPTGGTGGGPGGSGGGVITIGAGTLQHDGTVRANGLTGGGSGGRVAGGGAGGSVNVTVQTLNGAGTFGARGGDAPGTAGGGGGGRIAISFVQGDFELDATDFDVGGGVGGTTGDTGTVYTRDDTSDTVRIFHGFTFADVDHSELEWIADDSALNQYCEIGIASDATPSITAENVLLGGTIACTEPVASFDIIQTGPSKAFLLRDDAAITVNGALTLETVTTLQVGQGVTLANTRRATDLTFRLPDGNNQIWHGVTLNGAAEGRVVLEAAIDLSLLDGTTVRGNPGWPNLTALTIDATSSISADAKGCVAKPDGGSGGGDGRGPDCSNVCVVSAPGAGRAGNDFGGSGGGAYGGAGGNGGVGAGGTPYGDEANPRQFGASGGNVGGTEASGGDGGGLVRINVDGTFTNDGVVSAAGGNGGGTGGRTTAGGAGGAIAVNAVTYACTTGGTFAAPGGNGAVEGTTGGGGGGRILVEASSDTCIAAPLSALDPAAAAPGGTGTTANGEPGSVSFEAQLQSCADPVGAGSITASDALFVLRAAVGNECCDLCVCDVNDSSDVSATDALLTLRRAVGQAVDLLCPACL